MRQRTINTSIHCINSGCKIFNCSPYRACKTYGDRRKETDIQNVLVAFCLASCQIHRIILSLLWATYDSGPLLLLRTFRFVRSVEKDQFPKLLNSISYKKARNIFNYNFHSYIFRYDKHVFELRHGSM